MLKIESFTLQGSEGSGNFGNPIRVEELETIKPLISYISGQNNSSSSSSLDSPLGSVSPVRSQIDGYAESSTEEVPEPAFATQAPPYSVKANSIHSHTTKNNPSSARSSLIALLEANQPTNGGKGARRSSLKGKEEGSRTEATRFCDNQRSDVPDSTPMMLTNTIEELFSNTKTSSQPIREDSFGISTVISQHTASGSPTLTSTYMKGTRIAPEKGVSFDTNHAENEKENPKASMDNHCNSIKLAASKSPLPEGAGASGVEATKNPWMVLTRIPRKHVQIPKDQRRILERNDSWYPLKPDNGTAAQILPYDVFTELKAFHGTEVCSEEDTDEQSDNNSRGPRDFSECGSEIDSNRELSQHAESLNDLLVGSLQRGQVSLQHETVQQHSSPDSSHPSRARHLVLQAQSTSSEEFPAHPESEHGSAQACSRDDCVNLRPLSHSEALQEDIIPARSLNYAKMSIFEDASEPSSSPLEMEIDVPFGLPSTAEEPQLNLQVERTPYTKSEIQALQSFSRDCSNSISNNNATSKTFARGDSEHMSSDPVIPATFDVETVINQGQPKKSTPSIDVCAPSTIAQDEEISAGHQLLAEFETLSQRSGLTEEYTPTKAASGLPLIGNTAGKLGHQESQAIVFDIMNSPSPRILMHMSLLDTQAVALPALQAPKDLRGCVEKSIKQAKQLKRNLADASENPVSAHKRRHVMQSALFGSSQEDEPIVDPGEMAKANRRDFLRQLSTYHDVSKEGSEQSDNVAPMSAGIDYEGAAPEKRQNQNISASSPENKNQLETLFSLSDKDLVVMTQFQEDSSKSRYKVNREHFRHNKTSRDMIDRYILPSTNSLIFNNSEVLARESQGSAIDKIDTGNRNLSDGGNADEKTLNLFQKFCLAYPTYTESMNTFIKACVYLTQQRERKKAPVPILWDDFIRIFSTKYPLYVRDCQGTTQAPMNGIAYYNNFVDEPLFNARIVMTTNLHEALLLDPRVTSCSQELIQVASYSYKSQSSTSNSSQTTLGISEESRLSQHRIKNKSTSPVQNPGYSKGSSLSGLLKDKHLIPDQASADPLTLENRTCAKKPFFETPSQLVQYRRSPVDFYVRESSSLLAQRRNAIADEQIEYAKEDLSLTYAPKGKTSHLPWSSPSSTRLSQNISKTDQKVENFLEGSNLDFTPMSLPWHHHEGKLKTENLDLPRSREGSPILGSNMPRSLSKIGSPQRSRWSHPIKTTVASTQNRIFKTPGLPVSKLLGLRTRSMPGTGQSSAHNFPRQRTGGRPPATESGKRLRAFIPAPIATFKEFSKAFMSRRKRMSSVISGSSTPRSVITPTGTRQFAKSGHWPSREPETQAWTF